MNWEIITSSCFLQSSVSVFSSCFVQTGSFSLHWACTAYICFLQSIWSRRLSASDVFFSSLTCLRSSWLDWRYSDMSSSNRLTFSRCSWIVRSHSTLTPFEVFFNSVIFSLSSWLRRRYSDMSSISSLFLSFSASLCLVQLSVYLLTSTFYFEDF